MESHCSNEVGRGGGDGVSTGGDQGVGHKVAQEAIIKNNKRNF